MKRIMLGFVLLLSVSLFGCANKTNVNPVNITPQQNENTNVSKDVKAIVYENTKYGFKISLPQSWKGYKIIPNEWKGLAVGETEGEKVIEKGPMISIRHPEWTAKNPRQDIPIMVFTISQWEELQKDKFHIGAAPIGPRELGRNSKYVFALPARYNFAFPIGYEEVENILNSKSFQAIESYDNKKV